MTAETSSGGKAKGHASSSSGTSSATLENRLNTLREKSSKLSQTLTQKLATSQSGQNLLHIGPSLSTLPPDLHSLLTNLNPLLEDVEAYEKRSRDELERVNKSASSIRISQRRTENAKDCADMYRDLLVAEAFVETDSSLKQQQQRGNNSSVSLKKNQKPRSTRDDVVVDEDPLDFLEHVSSLERTAHITLNLIQELKQSTEQAAAITSSKPLSPSKVRTDSTGGAKLPSTTTEILPPDAEKAQFLMKLSPRIRRLESDVIKCLVKRFEIILQNTNNDEESKTANGLSSSQTSLSGIHKGSDFWMDAQYSEEEKNLIAIGHCLRGLALLGRGKEAENAFARVAIMPLIRSKLSMGRLDEGGSRGECSGLFSLLDNIACTISGKYGLILRLSEEIFDVSSVDALSLLKGGTHVEVDLVTAGVWVPIATALMADPSMKMAIFSPGIARILQANYSALDLFISELAERLLKDNTDKSPNHSSVADTSMNSMFFSPPSVSTQSIQLSQHRIYRHPMTAEFSKKWNLPIYYQLRFGDYCTRLNTAVNKVQLDGWNAAVFTGSNATFDDIMNNNGFELPVFIELFDILLGMWKADIILRPLTHRFLRGSLQLVGRVVAFVKEGMEEKIKFGAVPVEEEVTNTSSDRSEEGTDTKNNMQQIDTRYSWVERIEDVAAVAWELTVLNSCMQNEYLSTVVEAVAPQNVVERSNVSNSEEEVDELRKLVSETLIEASQEIEPLIEESWNEIIVNILIKSCCGPLSAVKGVAATYRMTNRPPPTQASPYVSMILRSLKEFDDNFSSRTPPQVGYGWKDKIVSIVSDRYSAAVEELLETVKRTEAALQNRRARRAATGGMSDGEKVKLQLYLDYKEFASSVSGIGVDITNINGLKKLGDLTVAAEALIST